MCFIFIVLFRYNYQQKKKKKKNQCVMCDISNSAILGPNGVHYNMQWIMCAVDKLIQFHQTA